MLDKNEGAEGRLMHTTGRRTLLWLCLLIGSVACWPLKSAVPSGTQPAGGDALAVVNLQAEPGDTVIRLSWQAVPEAGGYFVYRDHGSVPLHPTPIAEAHYEDIGLTNGRTYTYTVAAVTRDGQIGPPSAPIQAAPQSP